MAQRSDWDYVLRLKGVTLETLGMARLAQYMAEFAALLGEDAKPVFAGVVKGSVNLRARSRTEFPALTKSRLRHAAFDDDAPGHKSFDKLTSLMLSDGARGDVLDKSSAKVIDFPSKPPRAKSASREYIVADTGEVRGVVVAVEGIDDTAHIRLQDAATGTTTSVQVRNMDLARRAATYFRGPIVSLSVRGTWRRDEAGSWHPHSLYAEGIEPLEQEDALATFNALKKASTGWSRMSAEQADAACAELRGTD